MSWGERSCSVEKCGRAKAETCNVDCPLYVWDGKTKPDSTTNKKRITLEPTDVYQVEPLKKAKPEYKHERSKPKKWKRK